MSRTMAVMIAACTLGFAAETRAQTAAPQVPAEQQALQLPRQKLNGPRFGFTAFTGDVAKFREAVNLEPLMTQFGWQWETQVVSTQSHSKALVEWLVLVGGIEQSELNISTAMLAGYRMPNGVEFGVGPNFSFNKDSQDITTSMQVAGGATLPFGDLYVPVNLSVGIARGGPRFTALIGWIVGSGN